jgi:hypothetical protein
MIAVERERKRCFGDYGGAVKPIEIETINLNGRRTFEHVFRG